MRPLWIVVGGLLAGVLVVLGIAAFVLDREPNETAPPASVESAFAAVDHDDQAAENLVVAWNRWRMATFVSLGTWTRTLDGNDAPLSGDTYTAQMPPRRLSVRLGSVLESIDGSLVACDAPAEDLIVPDCVAVGGQLAYDDRVHAEMSLVLGYVTGETRIYDVSQTDDCFQVELQPAALRSPWGRAGEFCFDETSGALWSSQVRRQSAVDVEQTTAIRTDVTDADF